ncbi:MAG TPA: hypothetical protein VGI13_02500 [Candidatus Acidoferrum sp.]
MKSFGNAVCLTLCCCVLLLVWSAAIPGAHAQTVTVSPTDLSFGVPTGTPSPFQSAADSVTVNITGEGTVSFTGANTSGANPADFKITGNACTGTLTAPTTCQVSVTFTSSKAPATTLETATLNIFYGDGATISVPMNGGFGAIKLFSSINVNDSLFSGVTWPNSAGNPVKTTTINLLCPSNPTALLSSTPGTTSVIVNDVQQNVYGNVFQDNTLEVQNTPAKGQTATTTNVCYGGDPNFEGFTGFPSGTSNCFQQAYEGAVTGFVGQNPDLASGLLTNYGIQPLDLQNSTALFPPVLQSGLQSFFVELTDAGGFLGASTLHLITSCSITGITPGGTITGNPINPNDPSTQTQTFSFDNTGGQNISIVTSETVAIQQGATVPNGVVPVVTDFGIPQSAFNELVTGTSAGPAVCLRLTGEVDPMTGQTLCKGFLVQCYSADKSSLSGDNCVPRGSQFRNLFDAAKYTSLDAPAPTMQDQGQNFLNPMSPVNACKNIVPAGSCASGTGPGMLMGGDNWLAGAPTYSVSNCKLTGTLAGYLCPLDTLTQFKGAADALSGSTTTGRNSIYVPVVNMPLPSTTLSVAGLSNGWLNATTYSANLGIATTFTSNEATYAGAPPNVPNGNGFSPAAPYSVSYGIAPASNPLPDTTYSVATDTTQYADNPAVIKHPSTDPVQPPTSTANCTAKNASFAASDLFAPGDGIYNIHYVTSDCALTEGLVFNPTNAQLTDPTANWASFAFTTIGVDTATPQVSSCSSPNTNVWYNSNQTVTCTLTDPNYTAGVSGSGFLPLLPNSIQGSQSSEMVSASTSVGTGTSNPAATITPAQACDVAGNCVTIPGGPFMIDRIAPTIAGPSLSPASTGNVYFVGGPAVKVTYTCSDGTTPPNSGIASCTGPLPSGSTIDTSAAALGMHTFTVTAVDQAGNQTQSSVSYTVSYSSADVALISINVTGAETGEKVTYGFIASDLGPSAGQGVKITDALPAGLTFVSASFTNGVTSGNCSAVSGTVTCTLGTVPVLPARGSIYTGQITAKVTASSGTTISNTITISGLNPDPNPGNNSSTVKVKVTK